MKLVKLIANLGYGSRKQVALMFREGRITDPQGEVLYADDAIAHADVRVDGEPLDPPAGLLILLHKPTGYTCSTKDPGRVVYDLLPPRFRLRDPVLSTVGRLDRDTSGLLLMTDDGALLHRITSPKSHLPKVYEATLAQDFRGDEAEVFGSGTLLLESEKTPLAPAGFEALAPRRARITLVEGRYHQIRRMFAAVGNHVETLHRHSLGGLGLGDMAPGAWRNWAKPTARRSSGLQPRRSRSIPEIVELQRDLKLGLAQQRHRLLQVVALLAADPQLVAVDLGLDLELGLLERGDDLLRQFLLDALLDGDLLARTGQVHLGLGRLQAADVDAAGNQARAQDVEHLLELEVAGRLLHDHEAVELEARVLALEVEAVAELAVGGVHGIGEFVFIDFRNDVEGGHGGGVIVGTETDSKPRSGPGAGRST